VDKQPKKGAEGEVIPMLGFTAELRRGRSFNMSYGKMMQLRNRHAKEKAKKKAGVRNHVVA